MSQARRSGRLNRTDLTIAVLNTVVGAGVVALPGRAFAAAGSHVVLALALATLLALLVALAFGALARRYDGSGGPYRYVRESLGDRPALILVAGMVPTRALSAAASLRIFGETWGYQNGAAVLLTVGLGFVMIAIALLGVVTTVRAGNALGVLKIALLATITAAGAVWASSAGTVAQPPHSGPVDLGVAVLLWFYALSGFESPTILAAESRYPRRDLPRALLTGLLGAAALYAALMWVCLALTPDLARSPQPILAAVNTHAPALSQTLAMAFGLFVLAALPSQFAVAPRLIASVAADQGWLRTFRAGSDGTSRSAVIAFGITAAALSSLDLTSLIVASSAIRIATYVICCLGLCRVARRSSARRELLTGRAGLVACSATLILILLP